jgi:hypothetical protein
MSYGEACERVGRLEAARAYARPCDLDRLYPIKTEFACFRVDPARTAVRSAYADARRLLPPRLAVLYLQIAFGIEIDAQVLRTAVCERQMACYVVKSNRTPRLARDLNLRRAALEFTRRDLDRSPWLALMRYCRKCGAGFGEFMACELPDCELETGRQARARMTRQTADSVNGKHP